MTGRASIIRRGNAGAAQLRLGARALVTLVVVLAACRQNAADGEDAVAAARADSSAAGYNVGQSVDSTRPGRDTSHVAIARTPNASAPGAGHPGVPITTGPASGAGALNGTLIAGGVPRGKPVDSVRDTVRVAGGKTSPLPNGRDTTPRTDSVKAAPLPSGPVRVNEFLTYDARSRTVSLQLVAGYNGLNGSLNYNGATNGSHGISVPLGWRIHVSVANRDSDLQHSAIVVREVLPPPIEPTNPAFAGAALPQLDEGLHEDETGTLDFVVDREGRFMIACGVAGHAQAGMWLQLAVAKGALAPAYR